MSLTISFVARCVVPPRAFTTDSAPLGQHEFQISTADRTHARTTRVLSTRSHVLLGSVVRIIRKIHSSNGWASDIAGTFYHPCAKSVTGTPLMHLVLALAFVDVRRES